MSSLWPLLIPLSLWKASLNYHRQGHRERELSLGNGSGNYQSAACESPSLWRYGQLSKLQLIESATLKASLSHVFNWLQKRSHILARYISHWVYLDTAIVIFTLSYLNAASRWVRKELWDDTVDMLIWLDSQGTFLESAFLISFSCWT